MRESGTPSDHDARIVQALQIDGRAPFSTLAAVLGTSPQTVARRYARLREPGGLRVLGRTDAPGERTRWMVRIRSTPDAATAVAEAVARQDDTTFVGLVSGGTEVVCVTEGDGAETPLLHRLPRTPRVVGVRAHQLLHTAYGGRDGWFAKLGALTAEQVARLRRTAPPRQAPAALDDVDRVLLAALSRDGRAPAADLARDAGITESTVRRRVLRLAGAGPLYFDVQLDPARLGYRTMALLWLTVAPARLEPVAGALAGHPEVAFAAVTTGHTNLVAVVICRTAADLYAYLSRRLSALDGVTQAETVPVLRQVKHVTGAGLRP